MSSVRISAAKSGGDAVPLPGAASRAGNGAGSTGFAAALGATTENRRLPADPSPNNAHDEPAGRGGAAADANSSADAGSGSLATMPGFAQAGTQIGNQATTRAVSSTGQRGSAKPQAPVGGVDASVIAAALATPGSQPTSTTATPPPNSGAEAANPASEPVSGSVSATPRAGDATGQGASRMPAVAAGTLGRQPAPDVPTAAPTAGTIAADPSAPTLVAAIAGSAEGTDTRDAVDTGREALPSPAAASDGIGSTETTPPSRIGAPPVDAPAPKASPVASTGTADTGAPAGVNGVPDLRPHTPDALAADPPPGGSAGTPSAPAPSPAAGPARVAQSDAAALPAVAPEGIATALLSPIIAPSNGPATGGFTNTGRTAQVGAAVASDGVASVGMATSGGMASSGGIAASPVYAAAPGTADADAGAANVATQISGQVLRLLAGSGHEAVVRLSPPDLGDVTVRVAISGRDVSAWFGSSQPDVQQTISLALGQLQTDLGNAGYSLSGAWVGADTSGSGSRGGFAPPLPNAIAAAAAVPVTQTAAALSSSTGVSIYV